MSNRFDACSKCPAFHLLNEERKDQIIVWEQKRDRNIKRIKKVRMILVGESMPANRYFYDLDSAYKTGGMRLNLKEEFGKEELTDSQFLASFNRKGLVLYDAALCPLYLLKNNVEKRKAATYCLLTQNIRKIEENNSIPIVTIFPSNRGWLKNNIPDSIKNRIVANFSFSNLKGLKELYFSVKEAEK